MSGLAMTARTTGAAAPKPVQLLAELIEELSTDARADGLLIGWRRDGEVAQELVARGAFSWVPAADRMALLEATPVLASARWHWRWTRSAGSDRTLAGALETAGLTLMLSLSLSRASAAATLRFQKMAERLVPLLSEHLAQCTRLGAADDRADGLEAAIDSVDLGVALLDGDGRPGFVNAVLAKLLANRDGLMLNGSALAAAQLTDTIRLQSAIAHVLSNPTGRAPVVSIGRSGERRRLLVSIASPAQVSPRHAATLHVFDPDHDLQPLLEPVCRLYALSPVETRLTCLLADGSSLADAARAIRVREQTARSYLKQIFLKTDTNRQAELVWLMLKSCVRTARTRQVAFF